MSDRRVELADIETVKICVKDLRNIFEDTSKNKSKGVGEGFSSTFYPARPTDEPVEPETTQPVANTVEQTAVFEQSESTEPVKSKKTKCNRKREPVRA